MKVQQIMWSPILIYFLPEQENLCLTLSDKKDSRTKLVQVIIVCSVLKIRYFYPPEHVEHLL